MTEESRVTLFLLFAIAAIVESVSTKLWLPWFYRSAPPLWRVVVSPVALESPPELAIAEIANRSSWRPLVFHRLSDTEVAFRESYGSFRLGSGICGLILEDSAARTLTITTRCSWVIALGSVWAGIGAIATHSAGAVLVAVTLIGFLIGQRLRLGVMARAVAPQTSA